MTLPMKTHILTLAAIAALTTLAAADSPDAILKDYRTRAVQATQRLDETLNKQAAAIITDLVRIGDTAGAEAVTAQVKQKTAGEPLTNIHAAAATLFAQYDGARATAMKPVQAASIARLDSLLKVAGGPKIEALAEITKARAEIETGKVGATIDQFFVGKSWFTIAGSEYHFNKDGTGYRFNKLNYAEKVAFTWHQQPDGIVEVSQRKQPTDAPSPTYFRFENSKTAFQGDLVTNITTQLRK